MARETSFPGVCRGQEDLHGVLTSGSWLVLKHHYFPKVYPSLQQVSAVQPGKAPGNAACTALITQAGTALRIY